MFIRLMAAAAGAGAIFVTVGAFASDNGALEEVVVTAHNQWGNVTSFSWPSAVVQEVAP